MGEVWVCIYRHMFHSSQGDATGCGPQYMEKIAVSCVANVETKNHKLNASWWNFKYDLFMFIFIPKIGEDEPNLTNIFQMGWKPPTRMDLAPILLK